jgi:diaminopropionate ammonia-lyase family
MDVSTIQKEMCIFIATRVTDFAHGKGRVSRYPPPEHRGFPQDLRVHLHSSHLTLIPSSDGLRRSRNIIKYVSRTGPSMSTITIFALNLALSRIPLLITMSLRSSSQRPSSRRPTWVRQTSSNPLIPSADYSIQYNYHKALDGYEPTALLSLDALASELDLDGIYIKDESSRFSLPSFKASGASWGCFRALISHLSLDLTTATLEQVASVAQSRPCRLLAATDGNHGRAIAWMARSLGIESSIYVPHDLHPNFLRLIAAEDAEVIVVQGDYDFAVSTAASAAAALENNILVQDTAFEGYEDIPTWIIDGYATIFTELEEQLRELNAKPTTIITPVGVGSLAQAVITYAKGRRGLDTVAFEPETAACLHASLVAGKATSIITSNTINSGCNCGTLSSISWPYLRDYVDLSTTVSDYETHIAVQELHRHNVNAGPCGAAGLAALKRLVAEGHVAKGSSVILINTEARRPYDIPRDVDTDVAPREAYAPLQARL